MIAADEYERLALLLQRVVEQSHLLTLSIRAIALGGAGMYQYNIGNDRDRSRSGKLVKLTSENSKIIFRYM